MRFLSSVERIRDFTASPLYAHLPFKEAETGLTAKMKQNLIRCFKDEDAFGFMKENVRWKKLTEDL